MTRLEHNALGRVALPPARVLALYDGLRHLADTVARREMVALCESHERLRMELLGATELLAEVPADDAEPVTWGWLEAVVPNFALMAHHDMGGGYGPGWTVIVSRKEERWSVLLAARDGREGTCGRSCDSRGQVRRMFAAMEVPLTEATR